MFQSSTCGCNGYDHAGLESLKYYNYLHILRGNRYAVAYQVDLSTGQDEKFYVT